MSYTFAFLSYSWNESYIGITPNQHPAYQGNPNSQGMMYWCVFPYSFTPLNYPLVQPVLSVYGENHGVFTYPADPQLLIPNNRGLRLSTFWLSLRWEQKENHINNRSGKRKKVAKKKHLLAVGVKAVFFFLNYIPPFLLCFLFGQGYTVTLFLMGGSGIDGANWQTNYCIANPPRPEVEPKTSGLFLSRCSAWSCGSSLLL